MRSTSSLFLLCLLYFYPVEKDGILDIIVYGRGFANFDKDTLNHYGLIMIDNLIGEYNCVTKVRYYDFQDLSRDANRQGLLPLSQLKTFIDGRK